MYPPAVEENVAVVSVGWARPSYAELWMAIGGTVVFALGWVAWDKTRAARQRTGRKIEALFLRAVGALSRRRLLLAQSGAEKLLNQTRMVPTSVVDRLPQGWGLAPTWVVRWFYASQTALPVLVALLGIVLPCLWIAGDPETWKAPPPPHDPMFPNAGKSDSSFALENWARGVPAQVRQWDGLPDALHTVRYPMMVLVVLIIALMLRRVVVATTHAANPEQQLRERAKRDQERHHATDGLSTYMTCWPVVALLVSALQCAEAHRQHRTSPPGSTVPRVSMRSAEQIIWRAYRSRKGRARRHHERVIKAHAERVVAALREAEARQDAEPEQALEDLMVMLLTIAERYAEGHVGRLLDDAQLGEGRCAPREGLRFVAVGVSVVALMTGAALADLPEAALGALLPLLVIGAVITLNRGKVPTPRQLTDLIIPR